MNSSLRLHLHEMLKLGRYALLVTAVALLAYAFAPASASAAFSLVKSWGGDGLGEGMFMGQITGLATDSHGDVYVVDEGGSRIEEFSASGAFIREWGSTGEGAGQMFEPVSIAIPDSGSQAGDVYVTDGRNFRVDEFTTEGIFIRTWGFGVKEDHKNEFEICTEKCRVGLPSGSDEGGFETPVGVAIDPTSGDVYISDPQNSDFKAIYKYEPDGKFIEPVGLSKISFGADGGAFDEPTALATSPNGDLYVVDAGNERVQELNPKGEFIRTWGRGVHEGEMGESEQFGICTSKCQIGGQGQAAGDFDFIKGSGESSIAIDPSGNIWVPDSGDFRVQEFTSDGNFVMGFGWGVLDGTEKKFETCTSVCQIGQRGISPPQFEIPIGVAAAPASGCGVYVTDAGGNDLVDNFGESSSAVCGGQPENPSIGGGSHESTNMGNTLPVQAPSSTVIGGTSIPTGIATTPKAVEEILLGCSKRELVLNDVLTHDGHVELTGSAARSLAGKKVKILFQDSKQVATATVGANGQFATTAPLPPTRLRNSNSARYIAEYGSQRSLDLKLTRRLSLEPPKFSGGTVTLIGQVLPPLDKPIAVVTVQQELECGKTTTVKRFTPSVRGRFRVTFTVPSGAKAGIYRLTSSVRETPGAKHNFATFSLPLPVILN